MIGAAFVDDTRWTSPTHRVHTMIFVVIEILATAALAALTVFGFLDAAVDHSLARAGPGTDAATTQAVLQASQEAALTYVGAILVMLAGRFIATRRRPRNLGVHLVVPAVTLLTGIGLALHWGYADHAEGRFLNGQGFAGGLLWGGLAAAAVMALPWDPGYWAVRARAALGVAALALLVALAFFGEAPGESGARIRLFGVQPIEGVKLIFVAFLAGILGRRAEQLRYQRTRRGWFQMPRPELLLPAVLVMVALFAGLFAVRDLGPTLILSLVFLGFYYAVTRSWVEVLLVALALPLMIAFLVAEPPAFLSENVLTRLEMWLDPWLNGRPGGDQLAASLWAFAAGGPRGQGWGTAEIRHLPTGHTDLILAHLSEVAGLFGLAIFLAGLFALVVQGMWIAHQNRTPERMLLAFGLSMLLFCQWLVIFSGSTGMLPLTGVVVPFLSYGKTSMVTFLVVVALLVRLAVSGLPRADRDELRQLQGGFTRVTLALLAAGIFALVVGARLMIVQRSEISRQGVLALGYDDSVFLRFDPRLHAIARRLRRGEIRDRNGEVIAGTDAAGRRVYPLGPAMGTLLGPVDPRLEPPSWGVEGLMDVYLRGLEQAEGELAVWVEVRPGTPNDRILFIVDTHELRDADEQRARLLQAPGTELLFTRLKKLDYGPLVPLAHLRGEERSRAIQEKADDVAARTIELSIDARLQQAASGILREVVPRYADRRLNEGAATGAVVLLEVDSGQVLARAQWPDYNPGREAAWRPGLSANDRRFLGSYGPWRDKTGIGGLYQAGSIFKVFTSLAWVRTGMETRGQACGTRGTETYPCTHSDAQGPYFTQPGWLEPIHDSHATVDGPSVDLTRGLEVSCNVFFAQVGLRLGPSPLEQLAAEGLEVDNGRSLSPGAPGSRHLASTAFGQGAARMHAMEAARMVATVGSGGVYRKCPTTMLYDATCEETLLVEPPSLIEPILSGMRRVIESGTARRFQAIDGVRVYAKTGTATDPGRSDEVPYGLRHGETAYKEHSWFVALAEPDVRDACDPTTPGRLALAAVVPRGGDGNGAALDVAQNLLRAARDLGYFREATPDSAPPR
jgi:cell division protein FtsW (lipid II flippase)